VGLLDSPLLQRLRGVRQLGLAYLVYSGVKHDRLEHSIGVVAAAQRMMDCLRLHAQDRQQFGTRPDADVPSPDKREVQVVRLAALLHDVGHAPFSHAIEPLLEEWYSDELSDLQATVTDRFRGASKIAPAEAVALLLVVSDSMQRVLEHPSFGSEGPASETASAIAARLVGSRDDLRASYLAPIITGDLDADKLDNLQRDSLHSGLPLGLDVGRILSKLRVGRLTWAEVRPDVQPALQPSGSDTQYHPFGVAKAGR
jgi:hypothetical protein